MARVYIDGVLDCTSESADEQGVYSRAVPLTVNGGRTSPASNEGSMEETSGDDTPRRHAIQRMPLPMVDGIYEADDRVAPVGATAGNGSPNVFHDRSGNSQRSTSGADGTWTPLERVHLERLSRPAVINTTRGGRSPNYGRLLNFTDEEIRDRQRAETRLNTPNVPKCLTPNCTVPMRDPLLDRLATPRYALLGTLSPASAQVPISNCYHTATRLEAKSMNGCSRPVTVTPEAKSSSNSVSDSVSSSHNTHQQSTAKASDAASHRTPTPQSDYARLARPRQAPPPPRLPAHVGAKAQMADFNRLARPRNRVERPSDVLVSYKQHQRPQRRYGGTTPITFEPTFTALKPPPSHNGRGAAPPTTWGDLTFRSRSQTAARTTQQPLGRPPTAAVTRHVDPITATTPTTTLTPAATRIESTAASPLGPEATPERPKPPLVVRTKRFVASEDTIWPPKDECAPPSGSVYATRRSASVPTQVSRR